MGISLYQILAATSSASTLAIIKANQLGGFFIAQALPSEEVT